MSTIPRLVISAPSSGHGKTAVSVGLLAALTARGYRAAGFKIGPDHVDAAYLGLAAGRPGRNLDPRMVGAKRMGPLFAHGAASLDIAVVEGTMGLFDGLAGRTDSESTAQISGLLRAPVILVVDVGAMGQSVAALVHGFRAYDELLWLGGVILNRVASSRHEQLLREALDDIGVPVLGALRRHALTEAGDAGAPLPSRHHGVAPVVHHNIDAVRAVRRLGEVIAGAVDIDRTMALARSAPRLTADAWSAEAEIAGAGSSDAQLASIAAMRIGRRPVVGVAFAYPETAELLAAAGAEVVPFDPLRDESLPSGVDGLVIGAALPESYAEELTFNGRLRSAVAAHAAAGKPIAAEGAGLVWLCRDYNGRPMCGVVDASARETDLVVLGYREATARSSSVLLPVGAQVVGHKMHRTSITPRAGLQAAWTWAGGPAEGFVQRGVHASYLGLHWAGTPSIASRFVAAASATAAPVPGQWSTPSSSPYGRPSVPLTTLPTAPVTAVPSAPGHAAAYSAPPGQTTRPLPGEGDAAALALPAPAPASAPTSPGASSPFGPALGPAMPTPWHADAGPSFAGTVPVSAVPQGSVAVPSGPVTPVPFSNGSSAAVLPADAPAPGASAGSAADASAPFAAPGLPAGLADAASRSGADPDSDPDLDLPERPDAPTDEARGAGGPSGVGGPTSAGPSAGGLSGPGGPSGVGGPSGAGLPASGLVAEGPWSDASAAAGESDAPGESDALGGSDALGDGDERPAPVEPAGGSGKAVWDSGIWRREEPPAATGEDSDEPTRVMRVDAASGAAGDTSPAATDGASVGVPSGENGPTAAPGLPSSGVVPTTADNASPPAHRPTGVDPADGDRAGDPSAAVGHLPSQPVSTPPAASERLMLVSNPATSAAVPVSSAPMPEGIAPVSAAPIGVTAMPAAETDLVPDETGGLYQSSAAAEAGLDHAGQAPVSAPPVSAPPAGSSASPSAGPAPMTAAPTSSGPTSSVSGLPGDGDLRGDGLRGDRDLRTGDGDLRGDRDLRGDGLRGGDLRGDGLRGDRDLRTGDGDLRGDGRGGVV